MELDARPAGEKWRRQKEETRGAREKYNLKQIFWFL